ncbi:MAG: hypothetical protein GQ474_05780 [Sulfurimonas sp.]|nr:hypothetical protein [Sulfurimonas sp.]
MNDIHTRRIKTAMVVYAMENSLGSYILNNEELKEDLSGSSIATIIARELKRGNEISEQETSLIVESSYLDEIFDFALDISKGSVIENYLKQLKQLFYTLKIFDIRNAVSHPNRPFPECYWFRAATIASDPLIEKLKLHDVTLSLHSAIAGNLIEPPEHWLSNVVWAIPNTLPANFDHEITGLLGRDKEFKELKKVLSVARNNLIAIVAPGGIGKTALVLQFLKDLSLTPEASQLIDSILFCSLKNEQLTADGIQEIAAIDGIDSIKETILDDLRSIYEDIELKSFEDACEKLATKRILICIDNLETLLIDSQKDFIELNQQLPLP